MFRIAPVSLMILALALGSPALADKKDDPKKAEEERQALRDMYQNVLARLYTAQPAAKDAIDKAAGHAVFSNFGMKILVVGGGTGKGVAIDARTRKETFMKMVELQAGLGMGAKKFSLVWVFETPESLRQFTDSGWELGGQTSAAAKAGDKGGAFQGALTVAPGVWLYQLTDAGLALELTAKGTKYFKDDALN
jgi:lipid-binding SYLF domain-containing protein